jgi:hypothetical protein
LFLHFVRAEEGSGEESARASDFFGGRALIPKSHEIGTLVFSDCAVKYFN